MHPAALILALATGAFGSLFKERQAASTAVTTVHTTVTETIYCTTTAIHTHTSIASAQLSSSSTPAPPIYSPPPVYTPPSSVVTPSVTQSAILSTPATSCTPSATVYTHSSKVSSSAGPILQSTSSVSVPVYSPPVYSSPPVYTPPPVHTSKATVAPVFTSTASAPHYTGAAAANYPVAPFAGALAAGFIAALV